MRAHLSRFMVRTGLLVLAVLLLAGRPALAQTLVSDFGQTGNTLSSSNTTRKIDVHPNGTIYVCYHGTNGVRVACSLDNGVTFGASVQVTASNVEAEVAVSSTGIVYVDYVVSSVAYVARSLDQGATFQTAVNAGALTGSQAHMATDGQYVYLVNQSGTKVLVSSNNGQSFTSVTLSGASQVYADVHVDPANHKVIVQVDNPSVKYYTSTNYGVSFSALQQPSPAGSVNYSVGAISSGFQGDFLLVGGYNNDLRINLATGALSTLSWTLPSSSQGRSLAADIYGNVATGYNSASNVYFQTSTNLGTTVSLPTLVATGSTISCAAINSTNGEVLFAYQSSTGAIYLQVFPGLLSNYQLLASITNLTFGTQTVGSSSSVTPMTVTNQSASAITINSLAITGDFSQTNDAPSTLAPGASLTVNVTFTPTVAGTRNGQVTIGYNSTLSRIITLTGTGTATPGQGAPTTQASGLSFSGVGQTQLTASWTRGNGANCAVFVAQAATGQAAPSAFVTYTANTAFGLGSPAGTGWTCVYNGTGTSVTVTGLTAALPYQVFVCEYNGGAGAQNYDTTATGGNLANQATAGSYFGLTFATDGTPGASLTGSASQSVLSGANATAVTANAPANFAFLNWTGTNGFVTSTSNPLTITNVTAACALTANFQTTVTYAITTSQTGSGTINGSTSVLAGSTPLFTFTPAGGNWVADVVANGISYGAVTSYQFSAINAPQTLSVIFASSSASTYSVVANGDPNGIIAPGYQALNAGACQTLVITPNRGYQLATLTLDGASQSLAGAAPAFALGNVNANHIVNATFAPMAFTVVLGTGANGTVTGEINGSTPFTSPQTLHYGDTVVFTLTPSGGFNVLNLLIDGIPYPAAAAGGTFTLPNVQSEHTIQINFVAAP